MRLLNSRRRFSSCIVTAEKRDVDVYFDRFLQIPERHLLRPGRRTTTTAFADDYDDDHRRMMMRIMQRTRSSSSSSRSGVGFVSIVDENERSKEEEELDQQLERRKEEGTIDIALQSNQTMITKKSENNNTSPAPFCRFCLEEETKSSKLISPCACKGSQRFVHASCLNRWQLMSLKNGCDRNGEECSVCKKKFDRPKDPFWKRVAKYAYVHLHKRRWFYGYAFFKWLKMSVDLIQCSGDQLPLVTLVVSSLAHLVDANMRYKRIIGLMNQDTTALSILQLELSVYFNRSLFWASKDNSDLAKCVEAFGFMLAWPTTALTLLGGWSINLNGDIWGWIKSIKDFAEESKYAGISKKTALSIALANLLVLFPVY